MKFRKNPGNSNNAMGIKSNPSHIHWPIFEYEKGESAEIGCVIFVSPAKHSDT